MLVEGGSRVITSALREQLADRVVVAVAPILLGKGRCRRGPGSQPGARWTAPGEPDGPPAGAGPRGRRDRTGPGAERQPTSIGVDRAVRHLRLPATDDGWCRPSTSRHGRRPPPWSGHRPRPIGDVIERARHCFRCCAAAASPAGVTTFSLRDNRGADVRNADSLVLRQLYWFGEQGWEPQLVSWWRRFLPPLLGHSGTRRERRLLRRVTQTISVPAVDVRSLLSELTCSSWIWRGRSMSRSRRAGSTCAPANQRSLSKCCPGLQLRQLLADLCRDDVQLPGQDRGVRPEASTTGASQRRLLMRCSATPGSGGILRSTAPQRSRAHNCGRPTPGCRWTASHNDR